MFRSLGSLFLLVAIVAAGAKWYQAEKAYDPHAICAKQTRVSQESCLGQISLARSGGW